jgi:RNA recognition motif-containing protein
MSRGNAPPGIAQMYSLHVSHKTLDDVDTEDILKRFRPFGQIGDVFRPTMLHKRRPAKHLFVRYLSKADADRALEALNGQRIDGRVWQVEFAKQEHNFTQDTGFITNMHLDTPITVPVEFDSSMPSAHYQKKREEAVKEVDVVFSLRVDDLALDITPEELRFVFERFGEIVSIYYPFDLKARTYRGFAFVRFIRYQSAKNAMDTLHDTNIGKGRNILITWAKQPRYFSQDESDPNDVKSKKK